MRKPIFIFLIFIGSVLNAQETTTEHGPLITDRPDQTESPFLVPKGFFQVETGFLYSESSEGSLVESKNIFNSTLVRYGLLENLELRLGLEIGETKITTKGLGENTLKGTGPLYAGFKIGVAEEKGILPQIGFLAGVSLPFAACKDFKPENTGGDFRFAFAHSLSKKFGFSYNFGVSWSGEQTYPSYVFSTVLGYAFTEKLSGFIEVYGDFPEESSGNFLTNAGLTYLLSDRVQLDFAGGTGLNTNQDFYLGAGISARFPE